MIAPVHKPSNTVPNSAGPVLMQVPWSRPELNASESEAVDRVMASGWLGMGTVTAAAEKAVAKYIRAREAVFFNNGTSALMAAYLALDWGPGDEILVPTYTFAATVNALVVLGCRPVLLDCDPTTMNVDPKEVERVAQRHPKAKGLIFVDVGGLPCDLDGLRDVANAHHLATVEDAAEAFGAEYRNARVGARDHATIFSFHIAKQVTAVEGGAITTNDRTLAARLRRIRSHGEGDQKYIHPDIGLNFRPTDLHSAIALAQIERVDEFLKLHERYAQKYFDGLGKYVEFQKVPEYATAPGWMIFQVLCRDKRVRDQLDEHLNDAGVDTRRAFPPIHQQPYLKGRCISNGCPNADQVFDRVLSLPMGNGLREDEIDYVIDRAVEFFRK